MRDLGFGGRERRQCRCDNLVNAIAVSFCSTAVFLRIAFVFLVTITINKGSVTFFGDRSSALFNRGKAVHPIF